MIRLEFLTSEGWVVAGENFHSERIAWMSLGGDDVDYRTVDMDTDKVLTDKSKGE